MLNVLQPNPGDNNYRLNVGCMLAFVVFEVICLFAMVVMLVGHQPQPLKVH